LRAEILEPDLPIVDPHHHLWDRPDSRYCLDELLADLNSGHNVVATDVQLPRAVEWLQVLRRWRISRRTACTVPRHRNAVLPHPNLIGLETA
jgi:hypothetical protein